MSRLDSVSFQAKLRLKCYQETRYILHGFETRAKQRLPSRLRDLAQFGWLPLAAALFGTAEWQPQWLHHNFLPVIGLRVHAKLPPSPFVVSAASGVTRVVGTKTCLETPCRALAQAAELAFGLPTAFRAPEEWTASMKGEVFDLVQCFQRIYTGGLSDARSTSRSTLQWTGRRAAEP